MQAKECCTIEMPKTAAQACARALSRMRLLSAKESYRLQNLLHGGTLHIPEHVHGLSMEWEKPNFVFRQSEGCAPHGQLLRAQTHISSCQTL